MTVVLVSEALLISGKDFGLSEDSFTKDTCGRSLCLNAAEGLMDETVLVYFLGG